jgi:NAD(P)-dependent dehydrogenase (short-subunit alcohol dehydrogenase family)
MPFHNPPPMSERMRELGAAIERHYARHGRRVSVTFRQREGTDADAAPAARELDVDVAQT